MISSISSPAGGGGVRFALQICRPPTRKRMRNCAVVMIAVVLGAGIACSRDPATLRQKYVDSGDKYFKQNKFAEASVQYANAVRQDPESGMARMRLADA